MGDKESIPGDRGKASVATFLQDYGLTPEQAQAWLATIDLTLPETGPTVSAQTGEKDIKRAEGEHAPIKDFEKWRKENLDPAQNKFGEKVSAARNRVILKAKEKVKASKVQGAETLVDRLIGSKFDDLVMAFRDEGLKAAEKLDVNAHVKNFEARLLLLEKTTLDLVNNFQQLETVLTKAAEDKESAEKEKAERGKDLEEQAEKAKLVAARKKANTRLVELGPVPEAKKLKDDLIGAKTVDEVEAVDKEITKAQETSKETAGKGYKTSLQDVEKEINAKKVELAKNESAVLTLDGLLKQFKQAEVLVKSGNPEALEGIKLIAAKVKEVTDTVAKSGGALDLVFKKIDEVDKKLEDKDLKKDYEAEVNELTLASKDLRAAVDPFELGKAQTSADELAVKVDALVHKGEQLKAWREETKGKLETMSNNLVLFSDLRKGILRTVVGQITGSAETGMELELKEFKVEYLKPGADPIALGVRLDKLKEQMNKVGATLNKGKITEATKPLLEGDAKAGEELLKQRKEKADALAKWKTKYENFLKEVKVVEKLVTEANGEKEDLEIIRSIAKMALGKREAEDIEGADSQYDEAEKRLAELKAHPAGFTMKSSEEIAKTPELWNDALVDFTEKVSKIKDAASSAAGEQAGAVATLISSSVDVFMNKHIFTEASAILGNPAAKPADRKKAREQILREVRVYQAALKTNPVLELLRRNPFGVTHVTGAIVTFLSSLEVNALRAIRAE